MEHYLEAQAIMQDKQRVAEDMRRVYLVQRLPRSGVPSWVTGMLLPVCLMLLKKLGMRMG